MNKHVLLTYYEKYLRDIRGISDSSIDHYTQALRKISKMLVDREKVEETIYEIQDIGGDTVEWRVINVAEYGYQQRRRRTFIFAYKNDLNYAKEIANSINYIAEYSNELHRASIGKQIFSEFFAKTFPIEEMDVKKIKLEKLLKEKRQTWQYLMGAKKLHRKAANGHEYLYSEGAIPMIDVEDKLARTMLTSKGSFSRTTHIVKDKKTR